MSEAAVRASQTPVMDNISIARLHGQACIECGAVTRQLSPAGQIEHRGHRWAVVACDAHTSPKSAPGPATSPPARGLDQEARS